MQKSTTSRSFSTELRERRPWDSFGRTKNSERRRSVHGVLRPVADLRSPARGRRAALIESRPVARDPGSTATRTRGTGGRWPRPACSIVEQVVAGGHARPAIGHDRPSPLIPTAANFSAAASTPSRRPSSVEVLAAREAAGAGDVARADVERVGPPWKRSRWRASTTTLSGRRRPRRWRRAPRPGGEARGRARRDAALERVLRILQAAVEQRGVVAGRAQHPHQPRGHDPALVVVGHHDVLVADPQAPHLGAKSSGSGSGWRPRCGSAGAASWVSMST